MRFRSILTLGAVASLCAAASPLSGQPATAQKCTIRDTTYAGWKATELSNPWIKLEIVPQLGGRLMQVTFAGHDYLFVNPQLKGKILPVDPTQHRWINYGGDKIWPMPEDPPNGVADEQHWAGAAGEPLDDAPFTLQILAHAPDCTVRLTGPVDPQIGQQYIRDITITPTSPVISFHAVMKNVSGYPQSWSEQSVSQYNAASPTHPNQFNPDFWGITPANPSSAYLNGYHVRTGNSSNPGYQVHDGQFRLHWNNLGGEVWIDSPAGWAAVVDGTTGYTMVERIRYQPTANYPDKATILFFTTGQRTRPAATPSSDAPPILYMETELNSPVVELYPGETYAMDTQWFPARIGSDFKTTTYSGVIGQPLAATATTNALTLTGNFAVFYPGQLVVHFYNHDGEALGTAPLGPVSPLNPVKLHATLQPPPETARISLHLVDPEGLDRGPLGEAFVNPPPNLESTNQH
jgi:hypothetical protein